MNLSRYESNRANYTFMQELVLMYTATEGKKLSANLINRTEIKITNTVELPSYTD